MIDLTNTINALSNAAAGSKDPNHAALYAKAALDLSNAMMSLKILEAQLADHAGEGVAQDRPEGEPMGRDDTVTIHDYTPSARAQIDAALELMSLEAYKQVTPHAGAPDGWERADHISIADELDRIDAALGPKGASMFANLAGTLREVEKRLLAARKQL